MSLFRLLSRFSNYAWQYTVIIHYFTRFTNEKATKTEISSSVTCDDGDGERWWFVLLLLCVKLMAQHHINSLSHEKHTSTNFGTHIFNVCFLFPHGNITTKRTKYKHNTYRKWDRYRKSKNILKWNGRVCKNVALMRTMRIIWRHIDQ